MIFSVSLPPEILNKMILNLTLLIVGLVLILLGANYLVEGSSSIAKKFGLSEFVIGLTIVGIGTSTPEMVVSFMSAFQGKSDMALGNIVGSNIVNTLLILGVTALISPLLITRQNIKRDIPLNIAVTALLLLLGMKESIFGIGSDRLSRWDGALLLAIFGWYLWISLRTRNEEIPEDEESSEIKLYPYWKSGLFIAGGLAGLIFGGKMFVNSASSLAIAWGASEKFIAVTIMAVGTSMPELATCIVAALKGRGQLALGNILGSNISNIILILGGAALINPISFSSITTMDAAMLFFSAVFIFVTAFTFVKKKIDRVEGAILLGLEIVYMSYLITNL